MAPKLLPTVPGHTPSAAIAPNPALKKPGLLQRIVNNPAQAQLMLMGLGLLGSKRRSQADQYLAGVNSALTNMADANRKGPLEAAQARNLESQADYYDQQARSEARGPMAFGDTGATANALNVVARYGSLVSQGIPLTEPQKIEFETAKAFLAQQRTTYGPGGQPSISGGMNFGYLDPMDPVNPPPPDPVPGALPATPQAPAVPAPGAGPQVFPQTPAQIKVDQNMADEYVKWTTGGGASDIKKNLDQLANSLFKLESGQVQTGDIWAFMSSVAPDKLVSYLRPDFMNVREQVEEVAQRNLKEVLGAQFAKIEGEQLIKRAYNPNISTELNAQRIRRLMTQISEAAIEKQKAMDYYADNGTMVGYAPGIDSMEQLHEKLARPFDDKSLWGDIETGTGIPPGGALYYNPETEEFSEEPYH